MQKLSFLIIFLFVYASLIAQTRIKDKQEVYGTWKKGKSPYIIEGEAIVPKGKVLKIKPGVVLQFKTGTNRDYSQNGRKLNDFDLGFLRVNGKIIAVGKPGKLIKFTRYGNSGNWGNLHIKTNEKDNLLKYCQFEYSHFLRGVIDDDNATGAISFHTSTGTVENCLFINNGWAAINCKEGSSPKLLNLTISGFEYGIECNTNSSPNITNSIIWQTMNAFYINTGSKPSISYSLVQGDELPNEIIDAGNNLLGKAPDFTNAPEGDFSIKTTSPAYKTGKGGKNIGAL
jgi:hypothetical protein